MGLIQVGGGGVYWKFHGWFREHLLSVFDRVSQVNVLDSGDTENLALIERPDLGVTFTKLHCWRLTQYNKCVFLDADTMVRDSFVSETHSSLLDVRMNV